MTTILFEPRLDKICPRVVRPGATLTGIKPSQFMAGGLKFRIGNRTIALCSENKSVLCLGVETVSILIYLFSSYAPLRERLRTLKVFTKDQCFCLGCCGFSVESCVLDVY